MTEVFEEEFTHLRKKQIMETRRIAISFSFICMQMSLATVMDMFVEPFHNRVVEKTDRPIIGKSVIILSTEKVVSILCVSYYSIQRAEIQKTQLPTVFKKTL